MGYMEEYHCKRGGQIGPNEDVWHRCRDWCKRQCNLPRKLEICNKAVLATKEL